MRAAFLALAAFAATPALAAPSLTATLAAPTDGRVITRSGAWACTDEGCTLAAAASRPAVMCELLVKEAGAVTAFAANGVAFDEDALAKCNRKAR